MASPNRGFVVANTTHIATQAKRAWLSDGHPKALSFCGAAPFFRAIARARLGDLAADSRVLCRGGGLSLPLLDLLGEPCLDHRLARDAEALGFVVERLHHPIGKIDVHT